MDLQLAGRTYLVTGSSGGLGRATADVLVAEGANVVLVARREQTLNEALTEYGPQAASLPADLSRSDTGQQACRLALDRFGRLDGALISVGGPPAGSVVSTTEDDWQQGFDTVFLAALRTASAVIENGTAPDLAIAGVLSTSTRSPIPGLSVSNGLRPGLGMLFKQLADEHGPDGVRVNGIMPGRIDTDRVGYLDSLADDPQAARAEQEATIPLRRYGRPEELGRVAAFLLSPAASFISGSMIPVDGGVLRTL